MSLLTKNTELAIQYLRQGRIVAIPTETVYGLAGNAENDQAIQQIFAIKNRPLSHPLIMHVAHNQDLSPWVAHIPEYASLLMKQFWPGPMTLVFKSHVAGVNPLVTGGQDSIAIRCPAHPLAQTILNALDFPLVAPSANPFGKVSPTTAEHVQHSFQDQDLLILDGGRCNVGIESTIINATHASHYQILRPGMLDEACIENVLQNTAITDDSSIRVPGKMASHYQPEKTLYCFQNRQDMHRFCQENSAVYVLSFNKAEFANYPGFQLPDTPEKVAFELYYQLRRADQSDAKTILMELPPETNQWAGIRERALKAATLCSSLSVR